MKTLIQLSIFLSLSTYSLSQDYFEPLAGPTGTRFFPMCFDSTGYLYVGNSKLGIMRTADNGDTWEPINGNLSGFGFDDMLTGQNGTVYLGYGGKLSRLKIGAAIWTSIGGSMDLGPNTNIEMNSEGHLFVAGAGKLYRSTDESNNFELILEDLPTQFKLSFFGGNNNFLISKQQSKVLRLAEDGSVLKDISPTNQMLVYNAFLTDTGKLLFGSNTGLWQYDESLEEWISIEVIPGLSNLRIYSITKGPNGAIQLFGNIGNFKSSDDGISFQKLEDPPFSLASSESSLLRSKDGVHFFSSNQCGGGIFRSTNNGGSWERLDKVFSLQSTTSTFKIENGPLYALTCGINKVERSADNGETWEPILINGSMAAQRFWIDKSENLFAVDKMVNLYRSLDKGISWEVIYSNSLSLEEKKLSISPDGVLYLHVGKDLFRSNDLGDTWLFLSTGTSNYPLVWHPNGSIYSHYGPSLIKLSDDGVTWDIMESFQLSTFISRIHIAKTGEIYFWTYWPDPFGGLVIDYYVSYDNGISFEILELPIFPDLAYVYTCPDGEVLVTDGSKLFIQNLTSGEWGNLGGSLNAGFDINHIFVDDEGYIYLSMNEDVVYKSTVPCSSIVSNTEIKKDKSPPLSIFPNPFSSELSVALIPGNSGKLLFKLQSLQGQTILERYFDGPSLDIKDLNLPGGLYFYHVIKAGEILYSGKLVSQ